MSSNKRVRTVTASGSFEKMGLKIGRECAPISKSMLSAARAGLKERGISWGMAIEQSALRLPYAEEFDPEYVKFIRGYARGAQQRFEDMFVLLCQDEKGMCTDIAVNMDATADGSVMSAHTEDWKPEDEKHVVLVRGEPDGETSFLLMTLGGLEFIGGMNSAGISFTGNSLSQNDARVGIPKIFLADRIAGSETIGEAVSAALAIDRGSSYNSNICHSSGEMYSVEGSATDAALIYPKSGCLVHTNHYIHPKMAKYEGLFSEGGSGTYFPMGSSSLIRYNRALRLVKDKLGQVTRQTLISILSDHVDFPHSICRHADKSASRFDQSKTIYAMIADVTNLDLWVCLGEPCKGRFERHSLG